MHALHSGPRVGPMQNFVSQTSQMMSGSYHDSTLQHPPTLATLPWHDPRVTYTPGHYTPRNLRRDHLLQSNEYHRRRVEEIIEYSARFQWLHFRNAQEDDDLMYCFTPRPHFRLIEAWVEIFLTTPQCYLMMALEEVRVAFFEQTMSVPNPVQMHRRQTATSTAHSLKRKAAIVEDSLQIKLTYGVDNNLEERATESRKRFRNDDTAPRIEQFPSSSDLGRVLETVVSDTITQHPTTSQATTPHAPVASTTTVVAAPAVAAASQVQQTAPTTVTPATVAVPAPLADPIATMMARFPTRNTLDVSGRGCKGVAMSRGQIRAHLEIEGRTLATLPSSANSDDRHEMRGVAPPRTVDPTLINCVTTAQEMLTVRTSLLV